MIERKRRAMNPPLVIARHSTPPSLRVLLRKDSQKDDEAISEEGNSHEIASSFILHPLVKDEPKDSQ